MGFRALGLDTYPVASVEEAKEKVRELAKTDCAVIYLTEQLAKDMDDVLSHYKDELRPAIILIPGRECVCWDCAGGRRAGDADRV